MDYLSRTQSPPNSAVSTGSKKSRFFLPLSDHGMPRTPAPTSPGGSVHSHRFDRGQRSPGSPPMSARTFTTFYGSEPSYSPRADSHISNGSTLISSPTATPSLPAVPKFDNIDEVHKHRRNRSTPTSPILHGDEPSPKEPPPDSIEATTAPAAAEEDQSTCSPLSRLASRIRSILSSKQSAERKAETKRRSKEAKENLHRVEEVHWTEM